MEYIVGIAVIAAIVYLLTRKKEEAVVETAPYKVEVPEAKVEAVNAQPVANVATPAKAPAKKAAPKAKAPAKAQAKAPAKAKPASKKPAAKAKPKA